MEQTPPNNDYILTLFETCEILNKSSRTISRYVHKNILHPVGVKSRQGTLEYRFSRQEVEDLKKHEEQLRQMNFPNLLGMETGAASFASMSYPPTPVMPQTQFAIPGIKYPVVPGQSQPTQSTPPTTPADQSQSYRTDAQPAAAPVGKFPEASPTIANDPFRTEVPEADTPAMNRDNRQIITLLKETTEMLRGQLRVKDDQIKNLDEKIGQLIERNRETNILLKGLQDKMVLLEKPKNETAAARPEQPAAQSEEIKPAAAPAPQVPPVRLKVAYSDTVPSMDAPDAPEDSAAGDEGESDWGNAPARNDRQSGKSFFGKMFRQ